MPVKRLYVRCEIKDQYLYQRYGQMQCSITPTRRKAMSVPAGADPAHFADLPLASSADEARTFLQKRHPFAFVLERDGKLDFGRVTRVTYRSVTKDGLQQAIESVERIIRPADTHPDHPSHSKSAKLKKPRR